MVVRGTQITMRSGLLGHLHHRLAQQQQQAGLLPSSTPFENPLAVPPRSSCNPYPPHLVTSWVSPAGMKVTLRPIHPEDAAMEQSFVASLSSKSRYLRFMSTLRALTPRMLLRFTQIDYEQDMAFVATTQTATGETQIGVCRYAAISGKKRCEFAIAVADDWQGCGLGNRMMTQLIQYARACGLRNMHGYVLTSNEGMLKLCAKLGFTFEDSGEGPTVKRAALALAGAPIGALYDRPDAAPQRQSINGR